ncbi:Capsule polysaccharide export ATP-binding protein CtrD [Pseudodesulfovibrio profundus]|uniref:Capsule polysaccharide export ATP-binding protein CtrD n=1 Tax=Pseudodesulfovibrio profundus TaxID=57320 RepID=A0A2C8FC07_9BACT|nr:ABC transporter ATP-binding protein [Pseudodesulfovibrio profundus]SOB60066.1 Capsule polysaccharide export ATP-binding protein CtrD [Pseudodesulfovibrio profundus]
MIEAIRLTKKYKTKGQDNVVIDDVSFSLPMGTNVGFLGRNGAGKSTLLRLLSGVEKPTRGVVRKEGTISWPIGFSGGFQGSMSGYDNVRFVCRIYGAVFEDVIDFILSFSELGEYLYMPIASYSSGMRAKLAFGLSMAIDFNYYLIDEVTAVGDASFKKKSTAEFNKRKEHSTLVVVSHNAQTIKRMCDKVIVLDQGKLIEFDSVGEGIKYYSAL